MWQALWIAVGGAAGALLRFGFAGAANWLWGRHFAAPFPLGTLLVNLIGSAAIGAAAGWFPRSGWPAELRVALTVGVLGGFTTFSAYSYETIALLGERLRGLAVLNIVLNNVLSLGAAWIAFRLTFRAAG